MKNRIFKILRLTLVFVAVLSLGAAPALQAVQISSAVAKMNQSCPCCCNNPAEELSHPVKSFHMHKSCPCNVKEQTPINTEPIASTTSNTNHNEVGVDVTVPTNSVFAEINKTSEFVKIDYLPQKHPPLFILNASLLI